jgi:hypothetical protein
VIETRTAETIIIKACAVPGATEMAKVRAFEAARMAAKAAHVAAKTAHMTAAKTAHVTAACTHVAAASATGLCIARKQAAGQHGAGEDYHCPCLHHIILSTEPHPCSVGSAVGMLTPVSMLRSLEGSEPAPCFH